MTQFEPVHLCFTGLTFHIFLWKAGLAGFYHLNRERLWKAQSALQRLGTWCGLLPPASPCFQLWQMCLGVQLGVGDGSHPPSESLSLMHPRTKGDFSLLYKSFLLPEFNRYAVGKPNHGLEWLKFPIVPPTHRTAKSFADFSFSQWSSFVWAKPNHQPMSRTGKSSTESCLKQTAHLRGLSLLWIVDFSWFVNFLRCFKIKLYAMQCNFLKKVMVVEII